MYLILGEKQQIVMKQYYGASYGYAAWQEANYQEWLLVLHAESCPTQFALMSSTCGICNCGLGSIIIVANSKKPILTVSLHRVRTQHREHALIESILLFPDNDVTPCESSSPNKLPYITGEIWGPEDSACYNTITAQA